MWSCDISQVVASVHCCHVALSVHFSMQGDHILALLPSDIGGMATLSLYFTASLATPPGNSSPKRDNQVISLCDRLHEPPCSAISADRWVTACSVS